MPYPPEPPIGADVSPKRVITDWVERALRRDREFLVSQIQVQHVKFAAQLNKALSDASWEAAVDGQPAHALDTHVVQCLPPDFAVDTNGSSDPCENDTRTLPKPADDDILCSPPSAWDPAPVTITTSTKTGGQSHAPSCASDRSFKICSAESFRCSNATASASDPLGPPTVANFDRGMTNTSSTGVTRRGRQSIVKNCGPQTPEDLKVAVREAVRIRPYNVADYYSESGWATRVATSYLFEGCVLSVICVNALWIAYDTEQNHAAVLHEADWQFQVAENFLCSFYSLELVIRYLAFERKANCLKDGWFVFDSILVSMMIMETWLVTLVMTMFGSKMDSNPIIANGPILRLMRLMKLTRMTRIIRLLRFMPELMVLLRGVVQASRSVLCTCILLLMMTYVSAIALVQLSSDEADHFDYFQDVLTTMVQVLLFTVLPDIFPEIYDVSTTSMTLAITLAVVVIVGALIVLNMLVGLLVNIVSDVNRKEKDVMAAEFVRSQICHLIAETVDADDDGMISSEEFAQIITNRPLALAIREVGVDVVSLVDFSDVFFQECDLITPDAFVDVVLDLRGENTACVRDVLMMRKLLTKEIRDVVHNSIEDLGEWIQQQNVSKCNSNNWIE
jgi:voltage-gated sodium channel